MFAMGYELTPYDDRSIGSDRDGWTLQDYTLAGALGVESNYDAEALVAERLAQLDTDDHAALGVDEGLAGRVRFDSEYGCFFAHADGRADLDAVAKLIAAMVAAGAHPSATPGGITDSPAYVGPPASARWN